MIFPRSLSVNSSHSSTVVLLSILLFLSFYSFFPHANLLFPSSFFSSLSFYFFFSFHFPHQLFSQHSTFSWSILPPIKRPLKLQSIPRMVQSSVRFAVLSVLSKMLSLDPLCPGRHNTLELLFRVNSLEKLEKKTSVFFYSNTDISK